MDEQPHPDPPLMARQCLAPKTLRGSFGPTTDEATDDVPSWVRGPYSLGVIRKGGSGFLTHGMPFASNESNKRVQFVTIDELVPLLTR